MQLAQNHQGLKPLPSYMKEYVDTLPDPNEHEQTGVLYKTISAAYEIQLASRYSDHEADLGHAIGRTDTPIIKERPLIPKKPPEHFTGDRASQVLNEVEARLNLLNGSMLEILDRNHRETNYGRRYEAIRAIKGIRLPEEIDGVEHEIYQKIKRGCMWVHRLQKKNVE